MQEKLIEFPGADAERAVRESAPGQENAPQAALWDDAQDGAQGQTPAPQDGAPGQEYALQAAPRDGMRGERRAHRAAARKYAPRHARTTHPIAQSAAPRSLRAARAAARCRKRRRQRLFLLAGAVLAAVLFFVVRALLPAAEESQRPEGDNTNAYVPAAAIPHEGPPYVVAIDAGHGGVDVGAQGVVDESAMTETAVGYLEGWLLQDENYTPVRTHAYDTFLENADRAAAANAARAVLLLSVHGNSDPYSEKSYGFECYPQPPGRTYHDASVHFAHLIAEKVGTAGQRLRGNAGVRYIYYVGDDAHGYQKEVVEESDSTVRAEQTFGLLEKTDCPAVLAEQCFVTSPSDVDSWGGDDGCRLAARLYYEAICAYFGTEPLAE